MQMSKNVVIGHDVDIRNREDGGLVIGDNCAIDDAVRLVVGDGGVVLEQGTEIGKNTVINSGGIFRTGKYCLIAGSVHINTSTHGTDKNEFIKSQAHSHGSILIGDDVWVGSGASILINSEIGDAVLSPEMRL